MATNAEEIKAVMKEYETKMEMLQNSFFRQIEEKELMIKHLCTENAALKQLITELKTQLRHKD